MSRYWLLVALLAATLFAAERDLTPKEVPGIERGTPAWYVTPAGLASLSYSEVEARLYRFDINPTTPDSGINTGFVIAYGHPLRRPYRFEIADDSIVMLNGVQLEPALRSPDHVAAGTELKGILMKRVPVRWTAADLDSAGRVRSSLWRFAARVADRGRITTAAARDSIRQLLHAYQFVDTAACRVSFSEVDGWPTEGYVTYPIKVMRDEVQKTLVPATVVTRFTKPIVSTGTGAPSLGRAGDRALSLRGTLSRWSGDLAGGCLVVYSSRGRVVVPVGARPEPIRLICKDSLTGTEKLQALHQQLHNGVAVKEMVYNYDRAEYDAAFGTERR